MRLSRASDFALRLLILLAKSDRPLSIESAARTLDVPRSHLMKIAAKLSGADVVAAQRGPGGGIRLRPSSDAILVGDIVRIMEAELGVVDCLGGHPCACVFLPRCALKSAMATATEAFLAGLNQYTLAQISSGTQFPMPLRAAS